MKWLFAVTLEFLLVISIKLLAFVMVLGVVIDEGDVMPLHISPKGLGLNIDNFMDSGRLYFNRAWTR